MYDSFLLNPIKKLNIFSVITLSLIIVIIILADNILSNGPYRFDLTSASNLVAEPHRRQSSAPDKTDDCELKPDELVPFQPSDGSRFDSRVMGFFNQCKLQIFMTWISPVDSFGKREFVGLESLFQTNPNCCLIILSNTMDSVEGSKILEPLTSQGFRVQAMSPDITSLMNNTPAAEWFENIKNGKNDPGLIPLPQNLSNLIRLAALYKYGGVYLDTDLIILKDISGLRNSIGAQSVDIKGQWTRLNNAVLVFDKSHPLVYKFLEEFALTFNGDIWGHNGPYLVSRVVRNMGKEKGFLNFTILPPSAFYPVDWTRIKGLFTRPMDRRGVRWVDMKIRQLSGSSYGVHLWNSRSRMVKIEQGSVIGALISNHCSISTRLVFSSL